MLSPRQRADMVNCFLLKTSWTSWGSKLACQMVEDHNLSFLQKFFQVVLNKKIILSPGLHKTISDKRSKTIVHHMGNAEDVDDTRHDSALLSINQSEPRPRAMNFWPLPCSWESEEGSSQQSYCNISIGPQSGSRAACRPSPSCKISFSTRMVQSYWSRYLALIGVL